jgi:hypothetical protein
MGVAVVEDTGGFTTRQFRASYALGRGLFSRVAESFEAAAPHLFRPMYALANMGHPSRVKNFAVGFNHNTADGRPTVGWESAPDIPEGLRLRYYGKFGGVPGGESARHLDQIGNSILVQNTGGNRGTVSPRAVHSDATAARTEDRVRHAYSLRAALCT